MSLMSLPLIRPLDLLNWDFILMTAFNLNYLPKGLIYKYSLTEAYVFDI